MISAGLGIVPCLEILVAQTENKTFRNAIADTYEDVQKGMTLSQSMKENSDVFPTLLVSMVEAGEVSGNLDTIMLRMAEHFEKETKTENKVKAAMVYPAVLAVVAIAVVIFMLIFIMPTFVGMFEGTGTELPGLTKLLLNISNSLKNRWYIYIGAVIALVIGISSYKKTDGGRRLFDSLKLRLPVVNEYLYHACHLKVYKDLVNPFVIGHTPLTGNGSGCQGCEQFCHRRKDGGRD